MKTAIDMLEDVSAEIIENTSLLEVIYRTADMEPEADNAVACLIRSMQKTLEKAHGYIEMLVANPAPLLHVPGGDDVSDIVFEAGIDSKNLKELASNFLQNYFSDKDNGNPRLYMASIIHDYAVKVCSEIESIESKLS
ncbi:hypothetical protein ACU631_12630 [Klebsiella aerogenes]